MDAFWKIIDAQLVELRRARSADDVMSVLSTQGRNADVGFFGGSGGDASVDGALSEAGWHYIWANASYHWAMSAPDGSSITYVEGDIYRGDERKRRERGQQCEHADTSCAVAGAPGIGRVVTCNTCGAELENTIRVLEIWEVE